MLVDFDLRHVVGGILGVAVAWAVLGPLLGRQLPREHWPQLVAAGMAIVIVVPVLVVLVDHTRFFAERGMREVGAPAFQEPVVSEAAAVATREVLQPGDTWAYTTAGGRCTELQGYYVLAFRFVPNEPDCDDPDVELFWQQHPPPGAAVVVRGDEFAVVRR